MNYPNLELDPRFQYRELSLSLPEGDYPMVIAVFSGVAGLNNDLTWWAADVHFPEGIPIGNDDTLIQRTGQVKFDTAPTNEELLAWAKKHIEEKRRVAGYRSQPRQMDEEQRAIIQGFLVTLCKSLSLFSVDQLQTVKSESTSLSRFHSIAPLLDPTYYSRVVHDGTLDSAEVQSEILTHFIEIRKLMDKQESIRQKYLKLRGE